MGKPLRVLIVEDLEDDALLIARELRRGGYDLAFQRVDTAAAFSATLSRQTWDVVIADYTLPRFSGLVALELLQESGFDLPFIVVSGTIGEDVAVAAMRAGAHDYLMKGNLARLVPAVERELQEAEVRRARRRAEEALQASEERFRRLAENAPDIVFRWTVDGGLEYVSPIVAEITGYTPQELLADPLLGFQIAAGGDPQLVAEYQNAIAEGTTLPSREFLYARKDGREAYMDIRSVVVRDSEGNVVAFEGILRDVTERKRAEEALRENERFLQNVFEAIQDGISVLDGDLNIVRVNQWMERMYADQKPLIGKKCHQVYQQRLSPCPWCPSIPTLETGEAHTEIVPYPTADEPTGWIELSAFPLRDAQGRVTGIIEYVRDITERKRAEVERERLLAAEREQRKLADTLRQVASTLNASLDREQVLQLILEQLAWVVDYDSTSVMLSKTDVLSFVAHRGFPSEALPSTELRIEALPYAQRVLEQQVTAIIPDTTTDPDWQDWPSSKHIRCWLGVPLVVQDRAIGLLNLDKEEPNFYTERDAQVAKAFADQAAIAIENARLYQDLQSQMDELKQAQAQLVQSAKMAAIGELAAGVAHELNNPLTGVLGFAELLLRKTPPDDPNWASLNTIVNEAHRARNTVRGLLDFSRQTEFHKQRADVNEIVRDTLALVRQKLMKHRITLEEGLAPGLPTLLLDVSRMKQVFLNLLINALHAMPQGGTLTVESEPVGNGVAVRVVDTGVGIPEEHLGRIFQPFFTTKSMGEGTGLGLSISLGIVQEHGGRIEVESQVDEGSTFTVWLPANRDWRDVGD